MYKPIDLHKKKSDVLIIHCSDPRFQSAYRQVIDDLDEYYDLLVLPGASKALVDYPNVVEYIKLLISMHGCKTIHILDHIECGAFGPVDDEIRAHEAMLHKAEKALQKAIADVRVVAHLLGEKNELRL